ncbi:TetR/AcrR family transcriptional regulator [Isoptericola croceus]|uniref:TetR/AcrR family transcriptional regulator n=1 Tax=Isoptericola croceus TaxID=3031406 RepID=UPI0023F7B0B4|nr:TetR/AcrR family transcriptional regulator [Isoptericola croceus]
MTPEVMSRADRQRQTREALVQTARAVFARDGYHGARLDSIAREAGYSKGAVYSNFAGKADLFLAVIDANLDLATPGDWDPFEPARSTPSGPRQTSAGDDCPVDHASHTPVDDAELEEVLRGFALATLEFIASAARDEALTARMATKMEAMIRLSDAVAERAPDDDELTTTERATLLTALEQGAALQSLGGVGHLDQRLLRVGFRRLLDPRRAALERVDDAHGETGLHRQEYREEIRRSIHDDGFTR